MYSTIIEYILEQYRYRNNDFDRSTLYYIIIFIRQKILRIFDIHSKHGRPEDNDGPHRLNDVVVSLIIHIMIRVIFYAKWM
jgi:hypothetical protein